MNLETLLLDVDSGVAKITLNRPNKKNAMNPRLHIEITDLLERLRDDDNVRVLVITGAGDAFCAGMDLKEFFHDLKIKNPPEFRRIFRLATEWRGRTLRYYPKPTIAMVNGFCFGGAFSIVEGCDLAVAANEATFGLSEINFGGFPGGSVSKSLANIMHPRDALLFAMTGRTFNGKEAAEMKFVNSSMPLEDLNRHTMALAREISAKDPAALRACKDAFRHSLDMGWEASVSYTEAREDQVYMALGDAQIARSSLFRARRPRSPMPLFPASIPPDFRGFR